MSRFTFPKNSDRTVVFGSTGSGKSVFMTWLLSHASIDKMPWIILDYKKERYIKSIPRVETLKLGTVPKHAGLYKVDVSFDDNLLVDNYLRDILAKGQIGIFADEGASLPQQEPRFTALKTVFAQGRSQHVPFLFGTQRPSWINRSVRSEGSYYAAFHMHNESDRKLAKEFMPQGIDKRLKPYHCYWYDVGRDVLLQLSPVNADEIMNRFDIRLKPKIKFI